MSSVNLFRALGGSLGVAVFGSKFSRAVQPALPAGAQATRPPYSTCPSAPTPPTSPQ
ncbi:hypothetical protein ACFYNY_20370 [Streptomyces sp. NPDC006530]|uniref:hypothetical protein n=1 Tax=Streptomyces sp. NPDC006530 TaxID=3364750 RepID=UPI00367824A4